MILADSKFDIIPSRFDAFKMIFFVNNSSFVTMFTYLTPQIKFLEDLRYSRTFLTPRQSWYR